MTVEHLAKLVALSSLFFSICFGLLFFSTPPTQLFEDALSAFPFIATLFGALSFAMFTYVDNISKELPDISSDTLKKELNSIIDKLSSLKREVLHNGMLIGALFILEIFAKGVAAYYAAHPQYREQVIIAYVFLSLRFSFFCTSIVAVFIQLRGFITSIDYRGIISKSKKQSSK